MFLMFRNDVVEYPTAAKAPKSSFIIVADPRLRFKMRVRQRNLLKFVCLEALCDNQSVKQMEHTFSKSVVTKLSAAEPNGPRSLIPTTTRALSIFATIFLHPV